MTEVTVSGAREPRDDPRPPGDSGQLWHAVDRLLDRSSLTGIVAHRLGPLAASRLRRLERPVPGELRQQERAASIANASAIPLLRRIRASCDGPLVLLKGPEIACLYPESGRDFGDLDLLSPQAEEVHRSLVGAGFSVVGDQVPARHHHLQPLRWPTGTLNVEVHTHPNWPKHLPVLGVSEILASGAPSRLGIDGLLAPSDVHHSLILAVHGWQHQPLRVVRDLIDLAAVSLAADEREIERGAAALSVERVWRTARRAVGALFYGERRSPSLLTWARSLDRVRPRTAREIDLEALISPFWWMPAPDALAHAARLVRRRLSAPA